MDARIRYWKLGFLAFTVLGCVAKPLGYQAVLVVRPQVLDGQVIQAINNPYTQASINHLTLKLSDVTAAEQDLGISRDLLNAQLDNPVVFSNLKANTTYRIRAYAYASSGTGELISTSDANSYSDVVVASDDRPALTALKVRLIDKTFNGIATSSISLTNGGYSPVASESLLSTYTSINIAGDVQATGSTDGAGSIARFNYPFGIADDRLGNLYVAEFTGSRIRKVTPQGVVSTLAGSSPGYADGTGTSAKFSSSSAVLVYPNTGDLYVADSQNNLIRKVTPQGVVTTFAGRTSGGFTDGTGTAALLNFPEDIVVDSSGNFYVTDRYNNAIRKITSTGAVTTLAGNGTASHADGTGTNALFNQPFGIAIDSSNNMYVTEYGGHCVRKVTTTGVVTTIAGAYGIADYVDGSAAQARFNTPFGIAVDCAGNLFIGDCVNGRVRQITPSGVVTTIAGGGAGTGEGPANSISYPHTQFVHVGYDGSLYVTTKHALRKLK